MKSFGPRGKTLVWLLSSPLLVLLSVVYRMAVIVRNLAFDQGWLKTKSFSVPILSIGNITSGGTGKTPFTAYIIEELAARGLQIGLVSRGYGGTEKGPVLVPKESSAQTALRFGDEPSWFAARFPQLPVVIGTDRSAAVEHLLKLNENKIDLIIADDAFQHRWLKRDFDIVLLDSTEPRWRYLALPWGRAREGFSALNRAKAAVITKVNLAENEQVVWLRRKIRTKNLKTLETSADITRLYQLNNSDLYEPNPDSFRGKKVLLFSAIGRPESFDRLVQVATGSEIVEHLVFPDHHLYTQADLARIEEKALALGAELIFSTEKDAVKISNWLPHVPCWICHLETRVTAGDIGAFYEAIHRLLV